CFQQVVDSNFGHDNFPFFIPVLSEAAVTFLRRHSLFSGQASFLFNYIPLPGHWGEKRLFDKYSTQCADFQAQKSCFCQNFI
ncbi:MAG: hypothetical protein J6R86_04515, partial [Lentisphaeria bacterium]|nr:hypothetical protein [Lentisphaeria bacterium]